MISRAINMLLNLLVFTNVNNPSLLHGDGALKTKMCVHRGDLAVNQYAVRINDIIHLSLPG
ncbi:TPA: hypothetical protein MIT76_01830 [Klebsiella pneumoniae]|nr:hypothetical protein [Klebsiella pneumoniae]HBY4191134.1 hypothetical protein [Klebsiella pneumoniae]